MYAHTCLGGGLAVLGFVELELMNGKVQGCHCLTARLVLAALQALSRGIRPKAEESGTKSRWWVSVCLRCHALSVHHQETPP